MARELCLVLELTSNAAAVDVAELLKFHQLDIEREGPTVRCFAGGRRLKPRQLRRHVLKLLRDGGAREGLVGEPRVLVWSDAHFRYIDPSDPDGGPERPDDWLESNLAPSDIRWSVRVEISTVFDHRPVRKRLRLLRRPVIADGARYTSSARATATTPRASPRKLRESRAYAPRRQHR